MFAPLGYALFAGHGLAPLAGAAWTPPAASEPARPAPRPAAPAPHPRRVAEGLDGLLTDGAAVRHPAAIRAAVRAFTCGDGFLPGQMIDRAI